MPSHTLLDPAAAVARPDEASIGSTAAFRAAPAVAIRAAMLLLLLLAGWLLAWLIRAADLVRIGRRIPRERIAGAWHRRMLDVLGVTISLRGQALRRPHLLVSNHVSWLDIPVIGACAPVRFVSRHDVKGWPVAGTLADACGSIYIKRGAHRSHLTAASIGKRLGSGSVALFPEGTTTDGTYVGPFRARLLQPAIDAGVPVQPVVLRYAPTRDGRNIAPFIGEDELLAHLLRILRSGSLQVEVVFLPALLPDEATGRGALSAQARRHVERALHAMCGRPETGDRYQ
jgi:1-acyl-sn-glycerol-3-phosphate acyltransferase